MEVGRCIFRHVSEFGHDSSPFYRCCSNKDTVSSSPAVTAIPFDFQRGLLIARPSRVCVVCALFAVALCTQRRATTTNHFATLHRPECSPLCRRRREWYVSFRTGLRRRIGSVRAMVSLINARTFWPELCNNTAIACDRPKMPSTYNSTLENAWLVLVTLIGGGMGTAAMLQTYRRSLLVVRTGSKNDDDEYDDDTGGGSASHFLRDSMSLR